MAERERNAPCSGSFALDTFSPGQVLSRHNGGRPKTVSVACPTCGRQLDGRSVNTSGGVKLEVDMAMVPRHADLRGRR